VSTLLGVESNGAKLAPPPILGHVFCKFPVKLVFMLVSLKILSLKLEHLENPIVWPPDRTTKSLRFSPWDLKFVMSCEKLKNGGGRFEFAASLLANLESLLPNKTWYQYCLPPSCWLKKNLLVVNVIKIQLMTRKN